MGTWTTTAQNLASERLASAMKGGTIEFLSAGGTKLLSFKINQYNEASGGSCLIASIAAGEVHNSGTIDEFRIKGSGGNELYEDGTVGITGSGANFEVTDANDLAVEGEKARFNVKTLRISWGE